MAAVLACALGRYGPPSEDTSAGPRRAGPRRGRSTSSRVARALAVSLLATAIAVAGFALTAGHRRRRSRGAQAGLHVRR